MAKMIVKVVTICITKEPEDIQIVSEYGNASAYDVLFCTYKSMNSLLVMNGKRRGLMDFQA
jgi:hypothetical protein